MVKKPKKKVWKTPDWLPTLRKALKGSRNKAAAFYRQLVGFSEARDYKAPHALRGTPSRPRSRVEPPFRLFKRHRA